MTGIEPGLVAVRRLRKQAIVEPREGDDAAQQRLAIRSARDEVGHTRGYDDIL
ncbi:hypothetical protein Q9R08_00565 [Microbacterium sp. QXD-8]|uniref:Uncharacterized protein n=1 Tax=Microbacterium psychrotolerans TaxID=3068321 RepID=A0ABU0YVX4_9MICO|nr:hypothetical protein [Microbacterium sp. QXD-8]MDQ7876457.1 hypothetical protein [Microbacterium sp. QXD-8]